MSGKDEDIFALILDDWAQLHTFQLDKWIYRGQRAASWDLKTSLERCCDEHGVKSGERGKAERELLREFRRAYHHYASHIPDQIRVVEWLALMQHYGAPTRLLDFSYSIHTAAYFATEHVEAEDVKAKKADDVRAKSSAVWAISFDWAMKASVSLLRKIRKNKDDLKKLSAKFSEDTEEIVSRLFLQPPHAITACPINPFRLNERLLIQKGLFLIPDNIELPFMKNLRNMPGHEKKENIKKICIPPTVGWELRRRLFDMNISRRSLFPGLEGYSQSLGIMHPVFFEGEEMRSDL